MIVQVVGVMNQLMPKMMTGCVHLLMEMVLRMAVIKTYTNLAIIINMITIIYLTYHLDFVTEMEGCHHILLSRDQLVEVCQ
jgi:hypothetical protein